MLESPIEITRYMPMPQFVSFLTHGMHIPKATLFDDDWEGLSRRMYEGWLSEKQEMDWAKEWTYISCWYQSFNESMAMWNIYGKYSEAIAIHTSTSALMDVIINNSFLKQYPKRFNFVTYMDYKLYPKPLFDSVVNRRSNSNKRHIFNNLLEEFYFKHRAFQHENEVRLCIVDKKPLDPFNKNPKSGIIVQNVIDCIDMITLAPYSPDWYAEAVKDIVRKYGSNIEVQRSELDWSKEAFNPKNIIF